MFISTDSTLSSASSWWQTSRTFWPQLDIDPTKNKVAVLRVVYYYYLCPLSHNITPCHFLPNQVFDIWVASITIWIFKTGVHSWLEFVQNSVWACIAISTFSLPGLFHMSASSAPTYEPSTWSWSSQCAIRLRSLSTPNLEWCCALMRTMKMEEEEECIRQLLLACGTFFTRFFLNICCTFTSRLLQL